MKTPNFKLKPLSLGLIASVAVVLMCMFSPAKAMAQDHVAHSVLDGRGYFYYSVQAAVEAGYQDRTIIMDCDWNLDETLGVCDSKSLTIDMNGHKITTNGQDTVVRLYENSSLTLFSSTSGEFTYEGYDNETCEAMDCFAKTGGLITGGYDSARGGGILMDARSTLTLDNVTIAGNKSRQAGGGLYAREDCSLHMKNGSSIEFNRALKGAGIFVEGEDFNVYMNASSVNRNGATDYGGGIYSEADATRFRMENGSQISENRAQQGGGIYFEKSYFTVKSDDKTGKMKGNATRYCADGSEWTNQYDGGAIYACKTKYFWNSDEGSIEGMTIDGNYTRYDSTSLLRDSGDGGGLYIYQENVKVINCVITNNKAASNGGGICWEMIGGYIENSTITGNVCNLNCENYEGGGVFHTRTYGFDLLGKVIIKGNSRSTSDNPDDFFLGSGAYITHGVDSGSIVGFRTDNESDCCIGENITTYTPGTYFFDLSGYYITKGTDHGGDLWQRHGNNHKFTVQLHGKTVGEYYPGETVTVDGSTGNDYIVFNKWLEDVSSGLWPFADYVEDETNPKLTFTMPENDVSLMCGYRAVDPTPAPRPSV